MIQPPGVVVCFILHIDCPFIHGFGLYIRWQQHHKSQHHPYNPQWDSKSHAFIPHLLVIKLYLLVITVKCAQTNRLMVLFIGKLSLSFILPAQAAQYLPIKNQLQQVRPTAQPRQHPPHKLPIPRHQKR